MPLLLYGGGNRAGSRSYHDRGTSHGPGVEGPGVINSVNDRLPVNTRAPGVKVARPTPSFWSTPAHRHVPRFTIIIVYYRRLRAARPQRFYGRSPLRRTLVTLWPLFGFRCFYFPGTTTTTGITKRKTRNENVCRRVRVPLERSDFRSNVFVGGRGGGVQSAYFKWFSLGDTSVKLSATIHPSDLSANVFSF